MSEGGCKIHWVLVVIIHINSIALIVQGDADKENKDNQEETRQEEGKGSGDAPKAEPASANAAEWDPSCHHQRRQ